MNEDKTNNSPTFSLPSTPQLNEGSNPTVPASNPIAPGASDSAQPATSSPFSPTAPSNSTAANPATDQANPSPNPEPAPVEAPPLVMTADAKDIKPVVEDTDEPPIVAPHAAGLIMDTMPQVAADVDRIEKEWVNKVKDIVKATQQDPYTQHRLMSKLKADYMAKRYNHELLVDEVD